MTSGGLLRVIDQRNFPHALAVQVKQPVTKLPIRLFPLTAIQAGDMALSGVARFGNLRLCQAAIEKRLND